MVVFATDVQWQCIVIKAHACSKSHKSKQQESSAQRHSRLKYRTFSLLACSIRVHLLFCIRRQIAVKILRCTQYIAVSKSSREPSSIGVRIRNS